MKSRSAHDKRKHNADDSEHMDVYNKDISLTGRWWAQSLFDTLTALNIIIHKVELDQVLIEQDFVQLHLYI